jgi:toxin ParE1/3/4
VKLRTVHFTTPAHHDLATLLENSAERHGIEAAVRLDARIDAVVTSLEQLRERGRRVPELLAAGIDEFREIIAAPLRIVYRAGPRDVWIVAVVDGRRQLTDVLLERARRSF